MTKEKDFIYNKKTALSKFETALDKNLVDKKILPILNIINESKNFFTSSSCAGRIALLELPDIGDKKNAKFLGKWHRIIEPDELISASKKAQKGQIWFLAQSPIIHVVTETNSDAENLLKIGILCGFKNSGLKSLGKKIVVEICSTERLDMPIGQDGILFCNDKYLFYLVEMANNVVNRSDKKLDKLKDSLKKKI